MPIVERSGRPSENSDPSRCVRNRRTSGARVALAALVAGFALVGCGGRTPQIHYYVLRAPDRSESAEVSASRDTGSGLGIGVEAFRVEPPFDDDRIVFRVGEGSPEVGFYAYHRWAAPLRRTLPGIAADALRGTPGVASIEPSRPGTRYDALLLGRILSLEEIDMADGQIVRVRLSLTLRLADDSDLWSATLGEETRTRTSDVEDVVRAMGRVISDAFARAESELAASLASRR